MTEREIISPNVDGFINTLEQSIKTWGAPTPEGTDEAIQEIIKLQRGGKLSSEQETRLFLLGLEAIDSDMF